MSAAANNSRFLGRIGTVTVFCLALIAVIPYFSSGTFFVVTDYSAFYVAGKFAASMPASHIYDLEAYQAFYSTVLPDEPNGYGWFYPPHFLMLHQALSVFSISVAKAIWLVATFLIFVYGVSLHARNLNDWILLLFAPAVLMNFFAAQTGFLAAGLSAIFLAHWQRNEFGSRAFSGISLGLLTFKPHLWLFVPVLLVLARKWAIIAIAAATLVVLAGVSVSAYGIEAWTAMIEGGLGGHQDIHRDSSDLIGKMSTLLALTVTALGQDWLLPTYLVGFAAASVGLYLMLTWRAPAMLVAAFAFACSFVLAPHNMQYDYMVLLLPCLLNWPYLRATGALQFASGLLLYAWPFMIVLIPGAETFPFGALVVMFFAGAVFDAARRARQRQSA